ncbi:MAG TPA: hypothetical protein VH482_37105 [Thermomicrobiales bacterium]
MDDRGRREPDDRFEQISRNLMRWVLGSGLLSLHVGVYLVTLVSLLLWNLIRSPSDIWVDEPLRRWGLVVVFHATAVAAGWAAWRLMRMGESPAASEIRTAQPRSWSVPAAPVPSPVAVESSPVRSATAIATTEEWARRWLRESVRIVRDAVGPNAVANGDDGLPERATASGVAGPGITDWGTLFARRTREMMATARDHISPTARPANGSMPTVPSAAASATPAGPAHTWPGAEPATIPAPAAPPATNGTWPAPTNGLAHGAEASPPSPKANGTVPPPGTAHPTTTASDDARGGDAPAMSEDARWTWVEAAAAAWLARREMDEPAAEPAPAPPPPADEPTATS